MLSIEWWGTAAFRIKYGNWIGLLDPYISRNPFASPALTLAYNEAAAGANQVFISHGHFDHIADIPQLVERNPALEIFAPKTAARSIRRDLADRGLSSANVREVSPGALAPQTSEKLSAIAHASGHVKFDFALIASTLYRASRSQAKSYLTKELITRYPCGEVVSYELNLGGFRIQYLGSAGPSDAMLEQWGQKPVDCLLLPLQGNSRICEIGARIVEKMKPRIVIPHHHDNFYPPVSQSIDISKFRKIVRDTFPQTRLIELSVGQSYSFNAIPSRQRAWSPTAEPQL